LVQRGLCGPSGAGKTYTGLRIAFALAEARGRERNRPGRVAVIDSENGSASKYVGESPDGFAWDFDVCELTSFSPTEYTQAISTAGGAGYDVILIDGLSQAWEGKDGALELVDKKKGGQGNQNSFTAWRDVTPMHRRLIEAILTSPADVICTLRAKTEYVMETNDKGKLEPKKVGTAPIQRQGMEYEFDVFCDIDTSHILTVTKTRCVALDGLTCVKPGPGFVEPIVKWLTTGEVVAPTQAAVQMEDRSRLQPVLEAILADAVRIGWDRKKLDAEILVDYRARTLDDMTSDDLMSLSRRLGRLPSKKEATPAATATPTQPAAPAANGTPGANGTHATPRDSGLVDTFALPARKVTTAQLTEIKELQGDELSRGDFRLTSRFGDRGAQSRDPRRSIVAP
jgi:hypothetical protein